MISRRRPSTLVSSHHTRRAYNRRLRELTHPCFFAEYVLPKLYLKIHYCISCAIHSHVVRVRSVAGRRNRAPPPRLRFNKDGKKISSVHVLAAPSLRSALCARFSLLTFAWYAGPLLLPPLPPLEEPLPAPKFLWLGL